MNNDQLNDFNKQHFDNDLLYFKKIYNQQKLLADVIQKNSIAKINKTKDIISKNSNTINECLSDIQNIDSQIRTIVKQNKINLKNDTNYTKFINSNYCKSFNNKINQINTTITQLKILLDKEGIELLPKN